jgi:predicted nucleotidyltransferase
MTSHLYSIFTETNALKILGHVIENPGREFIEKEIQKATGISKAGVNLALRRLAQKRLVERKRRGRMYFYTTQVNNPFIKQLKVLKNIARLSPLVKKIKGLSQKIILFGSWSRGENLKDSDIDLCLLTNSTEEVQQIAKKSGLRDKLQLIIRTPTGFAELEKKDPVFFKEIDRGIVLFSKESYES